MGTTITGKVTKTVTVGVGGYTSLLTISSTGSIEPTATGSDGILLPSDAAAAVIVNNGVIAASESSYDKYSFGVALNSAATLTNTGIIEGGAGGYYQLRPGYGYGQEGGDGVRGGAGVTVNNATGLILGGAGHYGNHYCGVGGDGVVLVGTGSTLSNTDVHGFIVGIAGGAGASGALAASRGGIGVLLSAGADASNASFITGGEGGAVQAISATAANGGDGADVTDSAITNLAGGHITGGAGGNAEGDATSPGYGGAGVSVLSLYGGRTELVNYGTIRGGAGGSDTGQKEGGGGQGGDGVTLTGSGAYFGNFGTVTGGTGGDSSAAGGFYAGSGGYGVILTNGGTGYNAGVITGGGAGGGGSGGSGRDGVALVTGAFFNSGTITGGGVSAFGVALGGGSGVIDFAGYFSNQGGKILGAKDGFGLEAAGNAGSYTGAATVVNTGVIYGGNNAAGLNSFYATSIRNNGDILGGYGSGAGAILLGDTARAGTLLNLGLIEGGNASFSATSPLDGGVGVYVTSSTLINAGKIYGGDGGYNQATSQYSGRGGYGVVISNGMVIDSGFIEAGYTGGPFPAPYAVTFAAAGTLELLTGADIVGEVAGNAADADVLAFGGSGTLDGIGEEFININDLSFASGAAWTIGGDQAGLANGQQISGFAAGDAIVLDGFSNAGLAGFSDGVLTLVDANSGNLLAMTFATPLAGDLLITDGGGETTLSLVPVTSGVTLAADVAEIVLSGGTASKMTVDPGAALTVADGGKLTSASILGKTTVLSGGTANSVSVVSHAVLTAYGGKLENTTVAAGGAAYFVGGVASNTTLAGGLVQLSDDVKISGKLDFQGSGGVLQVQQKQLPGVVISGFAGGDEIILDDAAASGKVKVTANGKVTISAGGKTYNLDIAGAKKGSNDFVFANHALTETTTKMAFVRPMASAAPAGATLPESVVIGGFQTTAAPVSGPLSASTAAPGWLTNEPLHVANGGIQTMVTLQS